ncbi:MAG: transcription antitermination factor NusB [Phycisphaerae bacterium]|jgi:N utilization substance protein B
MSDRPTDSKSKDAKAELLRRLAFDELYLLPGTQERGESTIDIEAELESLAPIDRERAMRMALRRLAFQVLFEMDARGIEDESFITDTIGRVEGLGPNAAALAISLVKGALAGRKTADEAFRTLAPEWPTHRLAGVDRAILRLCHHELAAGANPAPIVLNEAVELARHFSTDRSPAFINALLDKIAKGAAKVGEGG